MLRILIACLFLLPLAAFAQKKDGFFVADKEGKWYISHKVSRGETLFVVARRYHVPPAMLADANGLDYQDALASSIVYIPLGAYNYTYRTPTGSNDTRKLYYKVQGEESLGRISRMAGVSQRVIQELNNLPDNDLEPGQVLHVGWVLYDATQQPQYTSPSEPKKPSPVTEAAKPASTSVSHTANVKFELVEQKQPDGSVVTYLKKQDTTERDTLGVLGKLYMSQTSDGQNVIEEKGTVAFYDDGDGIKNKTFFAFHNTVSRGTIIKVYNPGSGKSVFVKVIGPLPGTKQYHNSILGLTGEARDELGVNNERAWCELSYAPR